MSAARVVVAALLVVFACASRPSGVSLKMKPAIYSSEEEARRAAEKELREMGEELDAPEQVVEKARNEALSMAVATAQDPYHSDMDGIRVDLGHSGEYAIEELEEAARKAEAQVHAAEKVVPSVVAVEVDTQNEQRQKQSSVDDIPVARRFKKAQASHKLFKEKLSDGAHHLLEDERGTRPQAFPYGFQMPFASSQQQLFPVHDMLRNTAPLRAPDLDAPEPSAQTFPQFPMAQNPFMPQQMQMQMPSFPMFPQMPNFGQQPGQQAMPPMAKAPAMPVMPAMPQLPFMQQMMQMMPQGMGQMQQPMFWQGAMPQFPPQMAFQPFGVQEAPKHHRRH